MRPGPLPCLACRYRAMTSLRGVKHMSSSSNQQCAWVQADGFTPQIQLKR